MTDRSQWILFFSAVGCGLTLIAIVILLLHKRRNGNVPQGDIGPLTSSIDGVKADAARNQSETQASIDASRQETKVASEGIRVQMDSNQLHAELDSKGILSSLIWVKAMMARWFSLVKTPPPPPPDEPPR
jgi:hypothetical protein